MMATPAFYALDGKPFTCCISMRQGMHLEWVMYVVTECNTVKQQPLLLAALAIMLSVFTANIFYALHGLYYSYTEVRLTGR